MWDLESSDLQQSSHGTCLDVTCLDVQISTQPPVPPPLQQVWDLESSDVVHTLTDHHKPVTQLRLHCGWLFTVSGGVVRVFDTASFACVHRLKASDYSGAIKSFCVSWEGRRIFLGSQARGTAALRSHATHCSATCDFLEKCNSDVLVLWLGSFLEKPGKAVL